MGCFHSVPAKHTKNTAVPEVLTPLEDPAVEMCEEWTSPVVVLDTSENRCLESVPIRPVSVEECLKSMESDSSKDGGSFEVSASSGMADAVSSAVAVNASRHMEESDDYDELEGNHPDTPGPIVSPNPMSPGADGPTTALVLEVEHPLSPKLPVPLVSRSSAGSRPTTSRLIEVADLGRMLLCLEIFHVWREEVLRAKIDSLRVQMDTVGRASELILAENERLRDEGPKSSPPVMKDFSCQSEYPIIPSPSLFLSPPSKFIHPGMAEFVTPPSSRGTSFGGIHSEQFKSPLSERNVQANFELLERLAKRPAGLPSTLFEK